MSPQPVALNLILCDLMIVDDKSRRPSLINCFSRREVVGVFPAKLDFIVVAALTNGHGTTTANLTIERLDTLGPIFQRTFPIRLSGPLKEVWCVIHVRECVFPFAGSYQAVLLIDGEIIAMRKFEINKKENAS